MSPLPDGRGEGHAARLWARVAEHAAARGERAGVADACAVAVAAARVSGAGLTMMTRADSGRVVCVTDRISERVEELQLTFGEGPCMDAHASGGPVLSPDLRAAEAQRRWPGFAPAAAAAGAGAIYAFPLQLGAVRLGVMDLYDREPRSLQAQELRDALVLADTATLLLVGRQGVDGAGDGAEPAGGPLNELEGYRAEIDQATGMISVQLGVGIEEAFVRLRAHAYASDSSLTDLAREVVSRRLRFSDDPGAGPEADGGSGHSGPGQG